MGEIDGESRVSEIPNIASGEISDLCLFQFYLIMKSRVRCFDLFLVAAKLYWGIHIISDLGGIY